MSGTHTYTFHTEFKNHAEVQLHIAKRAATEGGAYAYTTVFGEATIYRAATPSKLPDFLAGITGAAKNDAYENVLFYKGTWVRFSQSVLLREQNRAQVRG